MNSSRVDRNTIQQEQQQKLSLSLQLMILKTPPRTQCRNTPRQQQQPPSTSPAIVKAIKERKQVAAHDHYSLAVFE